MPKKYFTLSPDLEEAYKGIDTLIELYAQRIPKGRSVRKQTGHCDRCDTLLTFFERHMVTSETRTTVLHLKGHEIHHPARCHCETCRPLGINAAWTEQKARVIRVPKVQEVCSECLEETDVVKFRGGRSERLREMKNR